MKRLARLFSHLANSNTYIWLCILRLVNSTEKDVKHATLAAIANRK